jgi:CubicO group peptidase (beta-lactamase class C family)
MLVATALAHLAAQGRVDFTVPISTYARDLDPAIGRLTLHQLLSHTSGLADDTSYDGPHDEEALGAFVRSWRADRFFTEPGRVYSYSNPGYVLAGHVLAAAADTSFDEAMARLVFRPLGMARSTTLPMRAMTYPFAQAHDVGERGAFVVRPFPDDARYRPNGGAFTSAEEFAHFALAFVHEGRIGGSQALPAGVIERLSRAHERRPGGDPADSAGIAYGLVARRGNGVRVLQHGGARLGAGSIVRMAPERRFAVVILTNRTNSFLPRTLERITALALPSAGPAAPQKASPAKWSREERSGLVGTWVNHEPDLVVELFLDKGVLKARHPGDAAEGAEAVTKLGERRYAFAGQEIEALPGPDGRPLYLHLSGRALARRPLPGGATGE